MDRKKASELVRLTLLLLAIVCTTLLLLVYAQ
jgi:hypothetical protein